MGHRRPTKVQKHVGKILQGCKLHCVSDSVVHFVIPRFFVKLLLQGSQTADRRMIIFDPRLRIKMEIFESIGMLLSELSLQKT